MALPATIDSSAPAGTDAASGGDDQIRALKLYVVDVFGVPDGSAVTAAPFSITAGGIVTFKQNNVDFTDAAVLRDAAGNEYLKLTAIASAVNELTVSNADATVAPKIEATGGDTNVSINLVPKGTGRVQEGGSNILKDPPVIATAAPATPVAQTVYDDLIIRSGATGAIAAGRPR